MISSGPPPNCVREQGHVLFRVTVKIPWITSCCSECGIYIINDGDYVKWFDPRVHLEEHVGWLEHD